MPIYDSELTVKYSTIVDAQTNRETSILGLRLPLTNEHFYRGRVKVSKASADLVCYALLFRVSLRDCFMEINVRARRIFFCFCVQ
jgi:hypothetical protein